MEIVKLKTTDLTYIDQCDLLFKNFIKSELKYDNNLAYRDDFKSFKNDLTDIKNFLYSAIENNTVIGFLYCYINKSKSELNDVAHLGFLYVNEEYRNKKIATKLIETFINEIKLLGIKNIDVKVYNNNVIANKLYKKFGFDDLWINLRKEL